MKKEQLLKFLKAPLSINCFIAYIFIIPFLFITPFIDDIFRLLSIKDKAGIIELIKTPDFLWAFLGCFLVLLLIGGFQLSLANGIIKNKESPFDITVPSISSTQIIRGFLCWIGWELCCALFVLIGLILTFAVFFAIGFVTHAVSLPFKVIIWLLSVPAAVVMTVYMVLNIYAAFMRFLKTLKFYSCFAVVENYRYVKKYKGRFFLACLILFVLAQIVSLCWGQVAMWVVQDMRAFYVPNNWLFGLKMAICMLLCCVCGIYVALLQTMIVAKVVTWIEYKPTSKR